MDGAKLKAPQGASVLDVAMEYGVCIPHLCHVANLTDIGVCRLCIVEHVRNGRSTITTSCTLEVKEGMVIRTNSDRVRALRRNVAELLVAEAPNSRAVQDVALRCGVTNVRYPFRNKDCILCGRCVRVCGELWQAKAIGFVGREGSACGFSLRRPSGILQDVRHLRRYLPDDDHSVQRPDETRRGIPLRTMRVPADDECWFSRHLRFV
jgi:NADH dehydrogenase/NADH:ubiquinone oxidoreductase subunit G